MWLTAGDAGQVGGADGDAGLFAGANVDVLADDDRPALVGELGLQRVDEGAAGGQFAGAERRRASCAVDSVRGEPAPGGFFEGIIVATVPSGG